MGVSEDGAAQVWMVLVVCGGVPWCTVLVDASNDLCIILWPTRPSLRCNIGRLFLSSLEIHLYHLIVENVLPALFGW